MRSQFQSESATQMLSPVVWFCYSAVFAGLFAFGYALIAFTLHVVRLHLTSIYSPYGM